MNLNLNERIELVQRSSQRMVDALKLTKDVDWCTFMRRESWVLLKRAVELWWHVVRLKE